ncbi:ATP-binding protein [Cytobacillus solani]|uniref:ATP-binding protein n=1 Tax=Cytobacillus solani TaxID=1637975 RepID=UPI00257A7729|nr:ATP-binding protein [Cytobacillus solani]
MYVADEGPGIPKEILNSLGQPFFTTKEEGLGLLICEKIIEDHNGKIIVESEMGKGTIVILRIPNGQI